MIIHRVPSCMQMFCRCVVCLPWLRAAPRRVGRLLLRSQPGCAAGGFSPASACSAQWPIKLWHVLQNTSVVYTSINYGSIIYTQVRMTKILVMLYEYRYPDLCIHNEGVICIYIQLQLELDPSKMRSNRWAVAGG